MFGASQSGTHTVTSARNIPGYLENPARTAAGAAGNYFGGYQSDPNTLAGLQGLSGLGQNPNQYGYGNTLNNFNQLMGGDFLYGGEGFNAALGAAQADIQPRVQSAFNSAGRLNSGLAQAAMAEEMGNAFAGLYDNERSRQMQGLQLAPQVADYAATPFETLYNAGQLADNEYESNLDDFINRLRGVADVTGYSETTSQPFYGNDLANALGIGSSLLGLGQGLFGSGGDGGLLGGAGDFFGFGGDAADGALGDPALGSAGADGLGGIPLPPGSSNVLGGLTGGGTGGAAAGLSPALMSSLTGLGGFSGGLSGGAGALSSLAGPTALHGTLSPGLVSSLTSLGTGGGAAGAAGAAGGAAGATGGTVGAAAGSAPAAGGGALSGGLGAALGAAAPLALAGFGALSVRQKQAAQRAYLEPVLDKLYANRGQRVTMGGVTGTPFQTPDGKTYLASPSAANPANKGNARALYGIYDPSTRQYGSISMNGFWTDPKISAIVQNTFRPGSVSRDEILDLESQALQKRLDSGAQSFGD